MPLNFPSSPAVNDQYTFAGRTWVWNGSAWDSYNPGITAYVSAVNGFTGGVTLAAGSGITLTGSANVITIATTGGGVGATGPTGPQGNTGATGPVGDYVVTINGLTGILSLLPSTGISISSGGKGITFTNTGVVSFNGLAGAVTGVTTSTANTFTAIQQFNAGITSAGATFNGPFTTTNGNVYHNIASSTFTVQTTGAINLGDSELTNNSVYLTVDDLNGSIYLSGLVTATSSFSFGDVGAVINTFTLTTTATTANQVIGFVPADAYRSAEFYIQAEDTDGIKYESLKIMVVHDGTNTFNTQYGLIRTGSSLGTYTTTLGGIGNSQLRLRVTPTSANNTVFKVVVLGIPLT